MALGTATIQPRFENPREILGDRLREGSIYRLLADEGHKLFPPEHLRVVDRARGWPCPIPTAPVREWRSGNSRLSVSSRLSRAARKAAPDSNQGFADTRK
jgi:hypothetical protein